MKHSTPFLVALAWVAGAHAHIAITFPPPFRAASNPFSVQANIDYSMTSPLKADGSDFPCKGYQVDLGTPAGSSVVTWAAGSSVNFTTGSGALHSGGSCQVSLSYDKGASFTVIHSYIGSCPVGFGESFPFTVPSDAPAGDAMFAWTWFNEIGNREIYMNCASVTIGASSGARSTPTVEFSARPGLFVANLGNGCTTVEGKEVQFPDPGPDVTMKQSVTDDSGSFTGTCTAVKDIGGGTSGSVPANSTKPAASSPAANSTEPAPSPMVNGTEPAANSPEPAASPTVNGTEPAANSPDPAASPTLNGTEPAANSPDPAASPTLNGTEPAANNPDPAASPTVNGTDPAANSPEPAPVYSPASQASPESSAGGSPTGAGTNSTGTSPNTESPQLTVTAGGECSGAYTCQGSVHGPCCSQWGWCGSTDDYCGDGCQAGFGQCGAATVTANTTAPASASGSTLPGGTFEQNPAPDSDLTTSAGGECTGAYTCNGSVHGPCCSKWGWCGSTDDYCGDGCQAGFGQCGSASG